jgi:hypothetical protein
MKTIVKLLKSDAELIKEINTHDRGPGAEMNFSTLWELLQPEEMAGLAAIIKDDERTAAYFKKILRAMLRAYEAGPGPYG